MIAGVTAIPIAGRPECVTAKVSTADPAWGVFASSRAPGCPPADGYVVTKLVNGKWVIQFQTSGDNSTCAQDGVPDDVGRDLSICVAGPQAYLPCDSGMSGDELVPLTIRPKTCTNGGLQTSMAELWILKKLRWSSWGGESAKGKGLKYQAHYYPGYSGRPVTVEAFRLSRDCGADKPFYTRVRITAKRWRMRSKPFGGGRWRYTWMPAFTYVAKPYEPDCES